MVHAVAEGVAGDGLGHDPAVVHGVDGVVAAAAVMGQRVVLHAQDLGVADEAAQRQVPVRHGLLRFVQSFLSHSDFRNLKVAASNVKSLIH